MPVGRSAPKSALKLTQLFDELGADYVKWVQSRHVASGVSYAQLRLLGALYTQGPQIMNELSAALQVTPRYVTKLVDALEAEGLLERRAHATDRRATVIALTPRGGSLGVLMSGPHQQEVARLFNCLSEYERRGLLNLLGKVRDGLKDLQCDE
jgi:DNA-binding MarR family transcriptional regulator